MTLSAHMLNMNSTHDNQCNFAANKAVLDARAAGWWDSLLRVLATSSSQTLCSNKSMVSGSALKVKLVSGSPRLTAHETFQL